ncbi:hypothetical protein CSC94_18090, partial [Zhengella mangrovi]
MNILKRQAVRRGRRDTRASERLAGGVDGKAERCLDTDRLLHICLAGVLLAVSALVWAPSPAMAVELATNGSLEGVDPAVDRSTFNNTLPPGWTQITGTTSDTRNSSSADNAMTWVASPDGGDFVHSGTSSATYREGLEQTVTGLVPGNDYIVSFYQSASYMRIYCPAGVSVKWEVTFGAQSQFGADVTCPAKGTALPWVQQSMTFTATSATQILRFQVQIVSGGSLGYIAVDGISLQEAQAGFSISAVNDDFSAAPIVSGTGGTTPSVHLNDTVNGVAVDPAVIVTTLVSDGGLTGVSVASDGTL